MNGKLHLFELTCRSCLELYVAPVKLQCEHNLCRKCVLHHAVRSGKSLSVECFLCSHTSVYEAEEELVLDEAKKHAIDELRGNASDRVMCSRCMDVEAVFDCANCGHPLCNKCSELVHVGRMKDHKVLNISNNFKHRAPFCIKQGHEDERVKLQCSQDGQLLCLLCAQTDEVHKHHTLIPISEAAEEHKSRLRSALNLAFAKKTELQHLNSKLEGSFNEASRATEDSIYRFEEDVNRLKAAIDERHQELIKIVREHQTSQLKAVQTCKALIYKLIDKTNQNIADAERGIVAFSDVDTISTVAILKEEETAPLTLPNVMLPSFSIKWEPDSRIMINFQPFNPNASTSHRPPSPTTREVARAEKERQRKESDRTRQREKYFAPPGGDRASTSHLSIGAPAQPQNGALPRDLLATALPQTTGPFVWCSTPYYRVTDGGLTATRVEQEGWWGAVYSERSLPGSHIYWEVVVNSIHQDSSGLIVGVFQGVPSTDYTKCIGLGMNGTAYNVTTEATFHVSRRSRIGVLVRGDNVTFTHNGQRIASALLAPPVSATQWESPTAYHYACVFMYYPGDSVSLAFPNSPAMQSSPDASRSTVAPSPSFALQPGTLGTTPTGPPPPSPGGLSSPSPFPIPTGVRTGTPAPALRRGPSGHEVASSTYEWPSMYADPSV